MPAVFNDGDLVIGNSGPEVYYVQRGKRRWVPDLVTLVALNPQGTAAVQLIEQDELQAMPPGNPMPPMANGSLLVVTDGTYYHAWDGILRSVPDGRTLSTYPRDRVAIVDPEDIALLAAFIGPPLPSITDADKRVLEIDQYIRSLAPLPFEPEGNTPGPVTKRPGTTLVDGVPLEISEQIVHMSRQVADFVEISPISDVMWAGAAVTGASVKPGALAPIALSRSPGWITITTDLTAPGARTQSSRLDEPSLRTYVDTLNTLVNDLRPTDSAAAMSFRMERINTLEEAMVSFGLNVKGSGWGVDAKARLDTRLERSTTFGMFSQAYYQVSFTPDGSPPRFFADAVSLEDVKAYAGPDNPPCYVATVTYGRMLTFLVDSEKSSLEVKGALHATWQAAVSGQADLEAAVKNTLDRSAITAVIIGGSSGAAGNVIGDPGNNLLPWIKNQLQVTADLPAAPIQYTVRYLAPPHNLVRVTRTTDPVKIVDANVYGGRELVGSYAVCEGRGCGPIGTGILLNKGDDMTITATGSIWAGWVFIGRNGPEGLDGPPKPWYPLPTGDGVRGSSLIGGYNNTDWFQIGSGIRLNVPPERDQTELWLRINDNDMNNGNGQFDVAVTLRRRLPTINAID